MNATTKVGVVEYGDRPNLVLRWTDPETGRLRTLYDHAPVRSWLT